MSWADLKRDYHYVDRFLKGIVDPDEMAANDPGRLIDIVTSNIVNSSDFEYTGRTEPVSTVLSSGIWKGDCGTLINVFIVIMTGLGIDSSPHGWDMCLVTTVPLAVLGRDNKGNVDNGMWCFQEHHTVVVRGRSIDFLFGGVDPSTLGLIIASKADIDEAHHIYYRFADYTVYEAEEGYGYPYTLDVEHAKVFVTKRPARDPDCSCVLF